jgi:hypothetical protein
VGAGEAAVMAPLAKDPAGGYLLLAMLTLMGLGCLIAWGWSTIRQRRSTTGSRTASAMTMLAVLLAGKRRDMSKAWLAHLAGAPEKGIVLTAGQRYAAALGFLLSGARMRLHDIVGPVWRPVDWILTVESRVNAVITSSVGSLAIYIECHDGLHTLLTEGWGWCGGCGGCLFVLARWLRQRRGIEIAGVRDDDSSAE